nr:hypothetical protein [Candidatus Sigynarchaeota archaeon]
MGKGKGHVHPFFDWLNDLRTPANISYELGTTDHFLVWRAHDYTTSFTLRRCEAFVDGISSYNDTWSNSSTEMVFVNGLAIGTHGVVFRFYDGIGGMTEGNASVTVFNVVPILTRWIDSNLTADVYFVRDEGVSVTLGSIRIVDSSVGSPTYTVLVNGTSNATGTWQSGMNFSIAIGIFPPGNYNLTIVFDDGLGGTTTRYVYITWQAASPPLIILA